MVALVHTLSGCAHVLPIYEVFQRFVRQNRKSHKAVPIEVCNVQTGMVTVYPSACAAAKAIGYKSNSFLISPTKGYKTIGYYVVRRLDL